MPRPWYCRPGGSSLRALVTVLVALVTVAPAVSAIAFPWPALPVIPDTVVGPGEHLAFENGTWILAGSVHVADGGTLTVDNATFVVAATSNGLHVAGGGVLEVRSSRVAGAPADAERPTWTIAGEPGSRVVVVDSEVERGGGVRVRTDDALVHGSRFVDLWDGVAVAGVTLRLAGNAFERNDRAVVAEDAVLHLEGNSFTNDRRGLVDADSDVVVKGNTFTDVSYGIDSTRSQSMIVANVLDDKGDPWSEGLHARNSPSIVVRENSFTQWGTAMLFEDSNVLVENNTVDDSEAGVRAQRSALRLDENELHARQTALEVEDAPSTVVVTGNGFHGPLGPLPLGNTGIRVSDSHATFTGNTLHGFYWGLVASRSTTTHEHETMGGYGGGLIITEHGTVTVANSSLGSVNAYQPAGATVVVDSVLRGVSVRDHRDVLVARNEFPDTHHGVTLRGTAPVAAARAEVTDNVITFAPSGSLYRHGVHVVQTTAASDVLVARNVIRNAPEGIRLEAASGVLAEGNLILDPRIGVRIVDPHAALVVRANDVRGFGHAGILLEGADASTGYGLALASNTLTGGTGTGLVVDVKQTLVEGHVVETTGVGIVVDAPSVTLRDHVTRNAATGVRLAPGSGSVLLERVSALDGGVGFDVETFAQVECYTCVAERNAADGFRVRSASFGCVWCVSADNGGHGFHSTGDDLQVYFTDVLRNGGNGVESRGAGAGLHRVNASGNGNGFVILGAGSTCEVCRALHNRDTGLAVAHDALPLLLDNGWWEGNGAFGARVLNPASATTTLDATDSYWGSSKGPRHATNVPGDGDAVSDGVRYSPWRTTPPPP